MPSGVYKRGRFSLAEFFWSRVNQREPSECWEWIGAIKHSFYGDCRGDYAHRVSWRLHNKPEIPAGFHVCHKCDNRRCVNPGHLYLGTAKDNNADLSERNRYKSGAKGSRAKITAEQVIELRARAAILLERRSREETSKILAPEYGITHYTARAIIAGKRWGHLL